MNDQDLSKLLTAIEADIEKHPERLVDASVCIDMIGDLLDGCTGDIDLDAPLPPEGEDDEEDDWAELFKRAEHIVLSECDASLLLESLDNPPEPSEKVKQVVRKYIDNQKLAN